MDKKKFISLLLMLNACNLAVHIAAGISSEPMLGGDVSDYAEQGVIYFTNGEVDKAIAEFNIAVKINPRDYMAYYLRAKAYEHKNDIDKAIADYTETTKAGPGYLLTNYAYYYRGILYQRKECLDEALADYARLIKADSVNKIIKANAHNNCGLAYDRKGKFDRAISEYNRAIELTPRMLNVYYNRALSYVNLGAYSLAMADFGKELEINPTSFSAQHYNLALSYLSQKDYYRSWYEILKLTKAGEKVSRVLINDVRKARGLNKSPSYTPAVKRSIGR